MMQLPSVYQGFFADSVLRGILDSHEYTMDREYPPYDIYENEDGSILLEFAVAGYKREDFSIESSGNQIEVSAKKSASKDLKGKTRIARRAFKRVFTDTQGRFNLPGSTAALEDGILSVTVPLREEAKAQKISIR